MGWVRWRMITDDCLVELSDDVSPMRSQTDNALHVFVTCTHVLPHTCPCKVLSAQTLARGAPWMPGVNNSENIATESLRTLCVYIMISVRSLSRHSKRSHSFCVIEPRLDTWVSPQHVQDTDRTTHFDPVSDKTCSNVEHIHGERTYGNCVTDTSCTPQHLQHAELGERAVSDDSSRMP